MQRREVPCSVGKPKQAKKRDTKRNARNVTEDDVRTAARLLCLIMGGVVVTVWSMFQK